MWYPRVDLAVEKGYDRKGIWGGEGGGKIQRSLQFSENNTPMLLSRF